MASSKLYITLVLLLSFNTLQAQYATIPFQLAGKLIIIRATVGGQPGNFILDTGITDLVLNSRYFNGEPATARLQFNGLNGKSETIQQCRRSLEIGEQRWGVVNARVVSMQALESINGIPIHGLIGTDILQTHILLIDYQKLEIELYPINRKGENTAFAHLTPPDEVLAFKNKGGTPLISLHVGGLDLNLTLDTGAEVNLFAKKYLDQLDAFIGQRQQRRFSGFGQKAQEATFAPLSGVHTNLQEVAEMNTAFADLSHYNRHVPGPKADGIVGYEFLQQFRIAFNFKKREIYLWKIEDGLVVSDER